MVEPKFIPHINYTLVLHLIAGPPIHLQGNGIEVGRYVATWASSKAGKDMKFYADGVVMFAYTDVVLIQIKQD